MVRRSAKTMFREIAQERATDTRIQVQNNMV